MEGSDGSIYPFRHASTNDRSLRIGAVHRDVFERVSGRKHPIGF
jgi:hypothetical protein